MFVVVSQNWERCEVGLGDSTLQLKDVKTRLNQSMPESDDELQSAEKMNKVRLQTADANQNRHDEVHLELFWFYFYKTFSGETLWRPL